MSISIRRGKMAVALFAGALTFSVLPGCDSAPPVGSLEMGGDKAKNTIKPGDYAPKKDEAPKKGAAPKGRSAKERPEM